MMKFLILRYSLFLVRCSAVLFFLTSDTHYKMPTAGFALVASPSFFTTDH
jgi:hypothetical protein